MHGRLKIPRKLTVIPPDIGKLCLTSSLNIRGNHLTTLPASIVNLDSLRCLYISGNRICSLSEDLIEWVMSVPTNNNCAQWEPEWPEVRSNGHDVADLIRKLNGCKNHYARTDHRHNESPQRYTTF